MDKILSFIQPFFIQSLVWLWIALQSSFSLAHEFWLEPKAYQIEPGDTLEAHLRVGQDFIGDTLAYLPGNFDRFTLTINDKTQPVESRLGDMPALQETLSKPGLYSIAYISSGSQLTYDDNKKFRDFLSYEGIDWVLDAHQKRGLPDTGFKEAYRRYVKLLAAVGKGAGQDQVVGMPFEWVMLSNPYTDKGDIQAQLLWQGKPFADAQVSVFTKDSRTLYRTDEQGKVTIARGEGGSFLVNTVHMIEPSPRTQAVSDAVWESLWASLTFYAP